MMLQAVVRMSWVCCMLFSIGASIPVRKGHQTGYGSSSGAGLGYETGSAYATYPGYGSSGRNFDIELYKMMDELMQLQPNRLSIQSHWNVDHMPRGVVFKEESLVYPSSHAVYTKSGFQRARDSQTDSKYTTETFGDYVPGVPHDHDDHPGTHHDHPGTKS